MLLQVFSNGSPLINFWIVEYGSEKLCSVDWIIQGDENPAVKSYNHGFTQDFYEIISKMHYQLKAIDSKAEDILVLGKGKQCYLILIQKGVKKQPINKPTFLCQWWEQNTSPEISAVDYKKQWIFNIKQLTKRSGMQYCLSLRIQCHFFVLTQNQQKAQILTQTQTLILTQQQIIILT